MPQVAFVTQLSSPEQVPFARALVASLRDFGGALKDSPVWAYAGAEAGLSQADFHGLDVQVHRLELPAALKGYYFAGKVGACMQAEAAGGDRFTALAWMSCDTLFVQPPVLLGLEPGCAAAVRPVHHRNIGVLADRPLDSFWRHVYTQCGAGQGLMTVETFVGGERLHAYFNSHVFAVDPRLGLMGRWYAIFERLALDERFQETECADVPHKVFLHQAVFSALLANELGQERIRILPPQYSYPYNLHDQVSAEHKARSLNQLVSFAYEYAGLDPGQITDVEIEEPLRSWLAERNPSS